MNKKNIIILIIFILLGAAIFVWIIFHGKKSVNIVTNSQNTEDSQQQTADSVQDAVDSNQQTENTSQQSSVINNRTNEKPETAKPTVSDNRPSSTGKIVSRFVSWGFKKVDSRSVDTIVVHSNYNTLSNDPYSISGAIQQFKMYGVAAHYIIDRSGTIYQLVDEKNIAYHAGVSKMKDGRTDVNNFSIGIELMDKDSGDSPTDAQYKALNSLIAGIKNRWSIKYVVGHDDIAPGRKTDPWGFDWSKVNR